MAHKFDHINLSRLDSPERRKILPPEEILLELGLKPGDVMIDVGAGIGYFSFPAADIVGCSGKVVAADTSPEMLQELQSRINKSSTYLIETVHSEEYNFNVPANHFDFVLISLVLHEIEDKSRFLKAAESILKPNGTLAIIEWIKKPMEMGPTEHDRIGSEETETLFKDLRLFQKMIYTYNDYFYLAQGKKYL